MVEQPCARLLKPAVPAAGVIAPHPFVGVKLSDLVQVAKIDPREPQSIRTDARIWRRRGGHPGIVAPTWRPGLAGTHPNTAFLHW